MANVGSAAAGKTLIGNGNGASPTFKDIGTNSGLTAHGVVIAEGNGAFQATAAANDGQILTGVSGSNPIWVTPSISIIVLGNVIVDLTQVGITPIFTTINKTFCIIGVSCYANSLTGLIAGSQGNLGWTAPNYDDWMSNSDITNNSGSNITGQSVFNTTALGLKVLAVPPNTTVKLNIKSGSTATTNTETISIIGFYLP